MNEQNEIQRAAMKEEIRKVVREETENSRNPQVASIFSRTQDLIRAATTKIFSFHSNALTTPSNSSFIFSSKKRSMPGHPYRFNSKKFSRCSVSRPKLLSVAFFSKPQGDHYRAER